VSWETRTSGPEKRLWKQNDNTDVYELTSGSLAAPAAGDEGNVLSRLMKDARSASELAKLSRFRPGGFSDLVLLVEVSPPEARPELTDIVVTLEQEAVGDTDRAMVTVLSNVEAPVPIQLSRPDLSGSNFGTSELYAIFNRGDLSANAVEFTAPPQIAGRSFKRWLIDGREGAAASGPSSVSVKQSCRAVAEYEPVGQPAEGAAALAGVGASR
jgi:hypothetical protein